LAAVCHRGRSNITLAGSHCRDPRRLCPRLGSKPVPAPRTRYEVRASKSPSGFHRRDCNEHPLPSARKCVRGRVCGASSQAGLLYFRLGQYLGFLVPGNLGNLVLGNLVLAVPPLSSPPPPSPPTAPPISPPSAHAPPLRTCCLPLAALPSLPSHPAPLSSLFAIPVTGLSRAHPAAVVLSPPGALGAVSAGRSGARPGGRGGNLSRDTAGGGTSSYGRR
jgi:hypothetical protein